MYNRSCGTPWGEVFAWFFILTLETNLESFACSSQAVINLMIDSMATISISLEH